MANFIRLILVIGFRIGFWLLITSNFEITNLIVGFLIAVVIPLGSYKSLKIKALLPSLLTILKTLPNLLTETWQLIKIRRPIDIFKKQPMCSNTLQGSKFAQFIQVIAITSTPMSIVSGQYDDENWIVHIVGDKKDQP